MALAALCLLLPAGIAHAQTSDELFDPNTLQEVRLYINSRDLRQLREHVFENTHYPADLAWRNIRVRNVAVRSKGLSTRNPIKLGLRVEFEYYTPGQRFLGMKALLLDNLWNDPSMIRERVAMAFFARMGQVALRESFCRLYINNVFQGVYALVEDIDSAFVARTIDDGTGYVYEYHWVGPYYGEFLGEDFEAYKLRFEPRSHEREPDSAVYGPLREMLRVINEADDATFEEQAEQVLDLSQFVTHVAIEVFLAENDGLLGGAGMANFFLYGFPNTARHRFIVWDKDTTFSDIQFSVLTRADENVIFRRAFAVPRLRALYFQVLEDCARAATEDGWLESEIDRALAPIDAAAHEDPLKQFPNDQLDQAIVFLRDFARERSAFVLQEVAKVRGLQ